MEHEMRLQQEPMEMIRCGLKTIELRLYDEKRKQIAVGDTITFFSTKDPKDTLSVRVTALYPFASFAQLYQELPLLECGYTEENVQSASPQDMAAYYSQQEQNKYGVLGIGVALL